MKLLFFIFIFLFSPSPCNSQHITANKFTLTGEILGRKTGVVVLYYTDGKDTVTLNNGKFKFTGKVNGVSDAYLWTDTSNHNFSDHSVVRFLLEPGEIYINYNNGNAFIKGSKSQDEKKRFDITKALWLNKKNKILKSIDSLYNLYNYHLDDNSRRKINNLATAVDLINEKIKPFDMQYIRTHNESFLSVFLLSSYKRKLSIDTLQKYYSLFTSSVKNSDEGRKVLEYIYPLTNDISFRNSNPLMGKNMNDSLVNAHSIYDLSTKDTSGKKIDFKVFHGKYILIDFWASWCQPCIQNLPYFENLKNEFPPDSIQFLSVSLDSRIVDWKQAIKKYSLTGFQLSDLRAFNGIVPAYCKVAIGIPQYVLIDKDGKIINYNTPFPNDPKLKVLINNLLKGTMDKTFE